MIPLLFAAALAGSPAAPIVVTVEQRDATLSCAKLLTQTAAPDGTPFRRLDELPPKVEEHAVWRTVAGCPVREVVWEGQTYYVGSSNPAFDSGPLQGSRIQRRNSGSPDTAPDGR